MLNNPFSQFEQAQTEQQLTEFASAMREGGHSSFRLFLDSFTAQIKLAQDSDFSRIELLLQIAQRLFPEPVTYSPSWERIWEELSATAACKQRVFQTIAPADRNGEWQVIMDNPKAIQEVVCYPGLPFIEAAYLYAYFRPQLQKNEYLRLQKVQTLIQVTGLDE